MKKTFSWVTALLTGLVLMVTSCTNASQITFQDETKGNYTDEGLSTLVAKVKSTPNYSKTIFPNDWTEELKGGLLYQLTATPEPDTANPTQKTKAGKGSIFTYEEIINGKAKMDLDPVAWNIYLKAYLPEDISQRTIKTNALVLEASALNKDLSAGGETIKFDLKVPTSADNTKDAVGKVDIQVFFYSEDDLKSIDLATTGSGATQLSQNIPNVNSTTTETENLSGKVTVVDADKKYYSAHISGNVSAGTNIFTATFKNGENVPVVLLKHEEVLYVDGGNLSEKVIYIPQGSYRRIPDAPESLYASTEFAPSEETKLVLDENAKKYAQKVTVTTVNQTIDQISAAIKEVADKNKYNITFNWTDKSFNEDGFKIYLTTIAADKTKTSVVLYPNGINNIYVKKASDETANQDGTNIAYVKGSLSASSETVTISLPTGVFVENISMKSYNDLGPSKTDAKLLENTGAEAATQSTPIGKFTIAYNMVDNKGNPIPVKYFSGPESTTAGFVMAYDYGETTEKLMSKDNLNYPYFKYDKYVFGGWYYKDAAITTPVKIVTVNMKEKVTEGSDPTTEAFDKQNTNIVVYGSWLSPVQVEVTFPEYSLPKSLQAIGNQNPGEVIEPEIDASGNIGLKISIPADANGTISKPIFKLYDQDCTNILYSNGANDAMTNDSIALSKTGIDNDTLTWNIKKKVEAQVADSTGHAGDTTLVDDPKAFLTTHNGGIYKIYVAYTYTETGTNRTYIIDGNLYVKLTK